LKDQGSQIKSRIETEKKPFRSLGLLMCFLISAFFWLTLKMSQTKNHLMQIPVEYTMPENFTSTEDLPKTVPFTINARTGNLMTLNYRMQKNPLQISLSNSSYTSEQIADLLKDRIYAKVESISTPFELENISLDSLIQKTVPLATNNELNAKQGYTVMKQSISPSTITITGASKLLEEIDSLYLSKLVLKDLESNFTDSLHIIKNYSELIELSQEKAKLQIEIDQLVQKQISFYNAVLADTVRINASSPSSLYEKIDSSFFNISVVDSLVKIESKFKQVKILGYSPELY